jgi:protein involved in polysaccharide export with SLBB domain
LSCLAQAQDIQLTAEQQQLLDQLPPAQRQQALEALDQLNEQRRNADQGSADDEAKTESGLPPELLGGGEDRLSEEARASGRSRLVIDLIPREDLTIAELTEIDEDLALRRIVGSHYYELDENGNLVLPGLAEIALRGLTAGSIEERLGAEPYLKEFDISVSLLDVQSDAEVLEPFGYDIFALSVTGFEPVTSGPVPPDYVVGPGDSVRAQFFGNVNGDYEVEVSRDGILNLPNLGPVTVAGLSFSALRQDLDRRVQQKLIGTQVSVTMGQLRTIRVFVLGDANRPGSYVVSSLATISSALYSSGGISEIGSLRRIQLKRRGKVIANFDLYDLLLNGDTSADQRLLPGDVIFVPPIGPTVGAGGAVRRPAIYELKGETTVADLIRLAGGLLADAYPKASRLERIHPDDGRNVVSLDIDSKTELARELVDGDVLFVPEVLPLLNQTVRLEGHVQRPGPVELRPGMRLVDLIPDAGYLKPGADVDYVLIRREDSKTHRVSVVSAKLGDAWANPSSPENLQLRSRDTVHVFSMAYGRHRTVEPLLEELKLHSRSGRPHREVSVSGFVNAPGAYPLESDMRISDLVRAGGGLSEQAYTLKAELARYEVVNGMERETAIIEIDLAAILRGDESADVTLTEHDNLRISAIPQWDSLWSVELDGEVLFPGIYRVRRGETLRQVLARAGGLTDEAFPSGAVFLRESLKQREQEQIDTLIRRVKADLTTMSLETLDTTGAQALETGRVLLEQLRETEAVGRLVIDLKALAARIPNDELIDDVELRDGDRLLVPKQPQEVTVIGETQQNTSHLYQPGLSRDDYIEMSGGLTRRADQKLIYVVRASGAVVTANRSLWFGRSRGTEIRPGDTIVVPLETDRIRPLTLWSNVTQILYQAAIAVAAVNSFN